MYTRKYKLNEQCFDTITPRSAYWLGMLWGDGSCTGENKIRLDLGWEDREHLFAFRNFVGSEDRPVKEKFSLNSHYGSFGFRSWKVHNALTKFQLTQRKDQRTYLHFSLMQPAVRHHFIRGLFDADGSFYYDGHKKQTLFAEITGHLPILRDIRKILIEDGIINENKKIVKNGSIFRIRLAKQDTIKFIDYIYQGVPADKLKRKHSLAANYRERLNENTDENQMRQSTK